MVRPAQHERKPSRQDIWDAIQAHPEAFTTDFLGRRSLANQKTIEDYLKCLIAGGYISKDETCEPTSYTLLRDAGQHAPRLRLDGTPVTQGAGTENMWRSIYMLREFTHEDIAQHATTTDVKVSTKTARAYVGVLNRCGYLKVLRKAEPIKGRLAQYRLIRNTGPRPPQVQRVKRIYDPNIKEVFEPQVSA
jgi:hypothetical protein